MYRIQLARRAERGLRRIRQGDPPSFRRIVTAIHALAEDPRPAGAVKLAGFDPPAWRLRVGEYRVVYEIREQEVLVVVVNVAPRAEVYR
jgi:mRNA interferase RelE/StbE